jgi:hypothetical protein
MDISISKEQKSIVVFCCYAHEDEEHLNKLKGHLSPLQRLGLITVWHDRNISAGAVWDKEIKWQLSNAKIILLLISPDFINSPYCYGVEMQYALERHESGEATVIPVILRPTYWHVEPLDKLQALPTGGEPVTSKAWDSQDKAFYTVVLGIRNAVERRMAREEQLRKAEDARQARLAEEKRLQKARHLEQAHVAKDEQLRKGGETASDPALTPSPPNTELSRRALIRVGIGLSILMLGAGATYYAFSHNGSPTNVPPTDAPQTNGKHREWALQTSGTQKERLHGVAWSGSQFVAVGDQGTILTSPNGHDWTPQPSGPQDLYGIAWSGSQFVAVGNAGTILTSPNGYDWTPQYSVTDQGLNRIVWSGSQFVAVGDQGTILTSPNGYDWKPQHSVTDQALNRIVWSGTQFIVVGDQGTILTSPNGYDWKTWPPSTSSSVLLGIVWSGAQFVAVGTSGTILTSPNGHDWTPQHSGTEQNLYSIAWSGSQFVVVGTSGTILTSPNGHDWTPLHSVTERELNCIVWSGTQFVAVGDQGTILTSP